MFHGVAVCLLVSAYTAVMRLRFCVMPVQIMVKKLFFCAVYDEGRRSWEESSRVAQWCSYII